MLFICSLKSCKTHEREQEKMDSLHQQTSDKVYIINKISKLSYVTA